jgi:hypothetical protein
MATKTIQSSGAFLTRLNSVASNSLVNVSWSVIFAAKWSTAVPGVFPCAFALQGQVVSGVHNATHDWTEWFQDDPADGDDIETFSSSTTGSPVTQVVGSNSALVGKWIHIGLTRNVSGNTNFYVLTEGFNPSSPTFLFTPSNPGTTCGVDDGGNTLVWNDNSSDLGIGISIGHFIQCNVELTQAQVISQFQQRAPISTVTGGTYTYLVCDGDDLTNVATDTGNVATNFTGNTTGGSFSADTTQPQEWGGAVGPTSGSSQLRCSSRLATTTRMAV